MLCCFFFFFFFIYGIYSITCILRWSVFPETAINIGYSCQLLTDEMVDIFIVDGAEKDEVW